MKKHNISGALAIGALGLAGYLMLKDQNKPKGLPSGEIQKPHVEETTPEDFVRKQKQRKSRKSE